MVPSTGTKVSMINEMFEGSKWASRASDWYMIRLGKKIIQNYPEYLFSVFKFSII